MTIYERTNRQTGEVITGKWEDVSDLDKRIWTDPIEYEEYKHPIPKPLCTVVIETMGFQGLVMHTRIIFSLSDLKGIYLG